jgi:hypothetical protein
MAKIFHHTPPFPRYTSLGCYPLVYYIFAGREYWTACATCATAAKHTGVDGAGQAIKGIGADVHWEGPPETCEDCGAEIESAYGDPETEEVP